MLAFLKRKEKTSMRRVDDQDIVALQDGKIIDLALVNDSIFAEQLMGLSTAMTFEQKQVTLFSPAKGELTALFPTGHAFGITMKNGTEILVHIGINTVHAQGKGFEILCEQGQWVKAEDPIVKVNFKELSKNYDMTTMIILTRQNGKEYHFIPADSVVKKGDTIVW